VPSSCVPSRTKPKLDTAYYFAFFHDAEKKPAATAAGKGPCQTLPEEVMVVAQLARM
jgi:hypothetical protein